MRMTPILALAASAVTTFALVVPGNLTAEAVPTAEVAAVSAANKAANTSVRFATFNIRTARADRGTSRHWTRRALSVAREIKSRNPGIVAIQELSPGRADGKPVPVRNGLRQTTSLEKALKSIGAGKYQLTRVTSYVKPGARHGTQGTRILYDTSKYLLVSKCREKTGKSNWNRSCALVTPVKGGSPTSAAYAEFEDRRTGRNFFVISAHLDSSHSGSRGKEKVYDAQRARQVRTIYSKVNKLAHGKPIIFGGDINSWRTKIGSHAPYNYLYSRGFRDSTRAPRKIDARYPTINHWKKTLNPNRPGRQVAIDVIMLNRGKTFRTYENVMKVVDSSRPSDHNMVVSDLVL
jgi:endonuclease/exonuclease/phosphatase family metal-dependent hydrolase